MSEREDLRPWAQRVEDALDAKVAEFPEGYLESAFVRGTTNLTLLAGTGTTWTDISGITLSMACDLNDILIAVFTAAHSTDGTDDPRFRLVLDGSEILRSGGRPAQRRGCVKLITRKAGLSAGTHTIKVQWRHSTGGIHSQALNCLTAPTTDHCALLVKRLRA